jgi:ribosomal protein S18 acetylase RimI-like enzyme
MPNYTTQPTLDFTLAELADLFTRSFAGYFVPVHLTVPLLAGMLRRDDIDLAVSRVVLAEGQPAGFGLIARRGWSNRLAAMGTVEAWRGKGAGSHLMSELIREACERGERGMVLEVIKQNVKAIGLYEKHGFKKVRRLVGLSLPNPRTADAVQLQEIDIRAMANLICQYGLPDLPWQVAGETIAAVTPPARAYHLDAAYVVVTDPSAESITIRALLVEPQARGRGEATRLLKALFFHHPGKTWQVPPIFPETTVAPFERAGFVREGVSQWQMGIQFPTRVQT